MVNLHLNTDLIKLENQKSVLDNQNNFKISYPNFNRNIELLLKKITK